MSRADPLDPSAISAELNEQLIGNRVLVLDETTSTNDVVRQMAHQNAEGLVVFAEKQTAGRGQYGRNWESTPYLGLWCSILLRPKIPVSQSARLTNLLAQAIAATLHEEVGLAASIKLPNDVFVDGRKIAGVLVEMRVERNGEYAAIAGIGLNVNQVAADFPPELRNSSGSIAMTAGRSIARQQLAIALLRQLDSRYRSFRGA